MVTWPMTGTSSNWSYMSSLNLSIISILAAIFSFVSFSFALLVILNNSLPPGCSFFKITVPLADNCIVWKAELCDPSWSYFSVFLLLFVLHSPVVSGQSEFCSESLNTFQAISVLSGQFQYCPDSLNTIRTVSILYGRFQYCTDHFYTVRNVLILFGRFQYCPDIFNTVRTVSILSGQFQ